MARGSPVMRAAGEWRTRVSNFPNPVWKHGVEIDYLNSLSFLTEVNVTKSKVFVTNMQEFVVGNSTR